MMTVFYSTLDTHKNGRPKYTPTDGSILRHPGKALFVGFNIFFWRSAVRSLLILHILVSIMIIAVNFHILVINMIIAVIITVLVCIIVMSFSLRIIHVHKGDNDGIND